MDAPAISAGEMSELVDEETLAGPGEPGEEDHASPDQGAEPLLEPAVGSDDELCGVA
jgi:hypothetical protein